MARSSDIINKNAQRLPLIILLFFGCGIAYLYIKIGLIVLILIAIPGIAAYWLWYKTFFKTYMDYYTVLPFYVATVAGFLFHVIEEYSGKYSLAISRIFYFPWTESAFIISIMILSSFLILVALGLFYKNPIAGFAATLFVLTRFAELALFVFPFLQPAIEPHHPGLASEIINGVQVSNMPNYFRSATGHYYFPGMYTVLLPLIPSILYVKRLLFTTKNQQK